MRPRTRLPALVEGRGARSRHRLKKAQAKLHLFREAAILRLEPVFVRRSPMGGLSTLELFAPEEVSPDVPL